MSPTRRLGSFAFAIALLASACAVPSGSSSGSNAVGAGATSAPKRITVALEGMQLNFGSDDKGPAGEAPLLGLLHSGLFVRDTFATQVPRLAEAIPSQENGLWKVSSDGRMEVTWKIREDARWHDGAPVTAADLLFNAKLRQDPNIPDFAASELLLVESIEAADNRTVVVKWKEPYIRADDMGAFSQLRPSHILEQAHDAQTSEAFLQHPYWTNGFIGAGPFRLKELVAGSHIVLQAFDQYLLGRPKVDEIVVRFFTDMNTMVANLLSGDVELTFSRGFSLAQAAQLRERWSGGTVQLGFDNWFALWPQFVNPDPAIMLDLRFRRALYHTIDRQGIVDNLWGGLTEVAHTMVHPSTVGYKEFIEPNVVRYDYEVRRTAVLMDELGYRKGADGFYRDTAGQPFRIQVQSSGGDEAHDQGAVVITDYFKQAGIDAFPFLIPDSQRTDRELVSTFKGVGIWRGGNDPIVSFQTMHSRQSAVAPRWSGSNRSRYSNQEFDALIDQYVVTVSERARLPLTGQIIRHSTEQLNLMGLWYNIRPNAVGKRLQNVAWQQVTRGTMFWNAHIWDVSRP